MLTLYEWNRVTNLPSGYYVVRVKRHWQVSYWSASQQNWTDRSKRSKRRIYRDADYWDEVAERIDHGTCD